MGSLGTAKVVEQGVLADGYHLERQLQIAARRYAEARRSVDQARDDWRALSVQPGASAGAILAARARFEAVAARCNRLRSMIEDLEARLES